MDDDIDETCEREVAPEVEDEKQVSKPPRPTAAESIANKDLEEFIKKGVIRDDRAGFKWAFESLRRTTLADMLKKLNFPRTLRVTRDFARAVDTHDPTDHYQQHVAYVLHVNPRLVQHDDQQSVVILSQHDVEMYWSDISKSTHVSLHCYNAKVTPEAARRTDYIYPLNVRFTYAHPTTTRLALDLFAGQLYFGSYDEYVQVSSFLGLAYFADTGSLKIDPDGFIPPPERHEIPPWHRRADQYWDTFDVSPVPFLKQFLSVVRNHGAGIEHTHMGMMLDGHQLGKLEFGRGFKQRGPEDVAATVQARTPRLESKEQRDERMQAQGKRRREEEEETETGARSVKKQRAGEVAAAGKAAIARAAGARTPLVPMNPVPVTTVPPTAPAVVKQPSAKRVSQAAAKRRGIIAEAAPERAAAKGKSSKRKRADGECRII